MITWVFTFAGVVAAGYFLAEAATGAVDIGAETPRAARFRKPFTVIAVVIGFAIPMVFNSGFRDSPGYAWSLAGACAVAAIFAPRLVIATPDGLRRARYLRKDIFIPWDDLDHYEIRKGTFGVVDVYCIRTKDGRSVKVGDGNQDGSTLINNIGRYKNLPRLPFKY